MHQPGAAKQHRGEPAQRVKDLSGTKWGRQKVKEVFDGQNSFRIHKKIDDDSNSFRAGFFKLKG